METIEKKEQKRILTDLTIRGKWMLTYKLINQLGPEGFSGRMIGPYKDPVTGKVRHLTNSEGNILTGYWIANQKNVLNPDENHDDRLAVDWLVGHPLVGIENSQTKIHKDYINRKDKNPRITLVNLDHQDVVDLEEEDYIDKLIGLVSMDTGNRALGLEKLRFVLSSLNLSYRDEKLIGNPSIEKQKLRKRLKDYIRTSYDTAQRVNDILSRMEEAKALYEFKELVRTDIITSNNGMFMYHGNPLGTSFESVRRYFENQPEFQAELLSELYKKIQ